MNNKPYQSPKATVLKLVPCMSLARSTGATGEDVPWAVREAPNWGNDTDDSEWRKSKSIWDEE